MMEGERPTASLWVVARQDTGTQRVLGTGTGVDDDPCGQELWIARDKILEHGGHADDDIAGSQNSGSSEHSPDESINNLQSLPDKTRHRGDHSELKEAETQLFHHDRINDRRDAVLQMVQCMAGADQSKSETFLLIGGIENLRPKCRGSRRFCCWFIVHYSSFSRVDEYESSILCTGSGRHLSTTYAHLKPETCFPLLAWFPVRPGCACRCIGPHPDAHNATDDHQQ